MKAIKRIIPVEEVVDIMMTFNEAATLLAVCGSTGGSPTKSRRKHTDEIHKALLDVGVEYSPNVPRPMRTSLYFNDEEGV